MLRVCYVKIVLFVVLLMLLRLLVRRFFCFVDVAVNSTCFIDDVVLLLILTDV